VEYRSGQLLREHDSVPLLHHVSHGRLVLCLRVPLGSLTADGLCCRALALARCRGGDNPAWRGVARRTSRCRRVPETAAEW